MQQMIRLVLESNPTLLSQRILVQESEKLPEVRSGTAITGLSFSLATSVWDPDTGTLRFLPAATIGTSLSLGDPVRVLNGFELKKEREAARQEYRRIQSSLVTELLTAVKEVLRLAGRRDSLLKLQTYLQDYSDLIEKQVRAGVASPEPDKLWDLQERLIGVEADIEDVQNQLTATRLEAAFNLGGERWRELLELLAGLDSTNGPAGEAGQQTEG